MRDTETVLAAERALQAAMRSSDAEALERLLHPDLLAVAPDGSLVDRAADLAAHRSGRFAIAALDEVELDVRVAGDTAVTFAVLDVTGTIDGADASGRLRYTRTWVRDAATWRVLAAHIAPVARS